MAKLSWRNPFFYKKDIQKAIVNEFNRAFYWGVHGGNIINDDTDLTKYIDLAYNVNPDVYSVVRQISNKFTSIPYAIREVSDEDAKKRLKLLTKSTKYNYTYPQEAKYIKYKEEAYSEDLLPMPLDKPNVNQTWQEFWDLSETFLNTTGNVYWYMLRPDGGMNAGEPIAMYVLPSHLMEIVAKEKANYQALENPVDHYILTEGMQYVEFPEQDVIHIKYANPNYNVNGSHLYGQSSLRAAWRNIQMTNNGLDLSINTLKSGGAFGFLHAKDNQTPLTVEQAQNIKDRLSEMNKSEEELGRIAGISSSIGFTRVSLTTDELKPFDYFKYNTKQVCNALGWDDKLLNSDEGAKYDNMGIAEKRVVTGKIVPDINLFEEAINTKFLPLYKNYSNHVIDFMVKELPEMQQDYKTMVEWIEKSINIGLISRATGLKMMGMPVPDDKNMDVITVVNDLMTLDDAIMPSDDLTTI